jgi:hypothetical protein
MLLIMINENAQKFFIYFNFDIFDNLLFGTSIINQKENILIN